MSRDRGPHRKPEKRPSSLEPRDYTVDGESAVIEFLKFKPQALKKILCKAYQLKRAQELLQQYKQTQIPIETVADRDEDAVEVLRAPIVGKVEVIALDQKRFMQHVKDQQPKIILALDHITDPRNLGAIVRSAAFFGISMVVAPERRQVLLTGASVATAQGGFALCDLVQVVNLGRVLDELKEQNYWVIGTDMGGEPVESLVGEYEKVVLVLGSEDEGMSEGIRQRCDRITSIVGAERRVESLNVSVATGILLHRFCTLHPPLA